MPGRLISSQRMQERKDKVGRQTCEGTARHIPELQALVLETEEGLPC